MMSHGEIPEGHGIKTFTVGDPRYRDRAQTFAGGCWKEALRAFLEEVWRGSSGGQATIMFGPVGIRYDCHGGYELCGEIPPGFAAVTPPEFQQYLIDCDGSKEAELTLALAKLLHMNGNTLRLHFSNGAVLVLWRWYYGDSGLALSIENFPTNSPRFP